MSRSCGVIPSRRCLSEASTWAAERCIGGERKGGERMKLWKAWTDEEKAQLRGLAGTMIAAKVAARMDRSRHSVLNMTRRLGLPGATNCRCPWTIEEDEAIRRGLKAGKTTRQI